MSLLLQTKLQAASRCWLYFPTPTLCCMLPPVVKLRFLPSGLQQPSVSAVISLELWAAFSTADHLPLGARVSLCLPEPNILLLRPLYPCYLLFSDLSIGQSPDLVKPSSLSASSTLSPGDLLQTQTCDLKHNPQAITLYDFRPDLSPELQVSACSTYPPDGELGWVV